MSSHKKAPNSALQVFPRAKRICNDPAPHVPRSTRFFPFIAPLTLPLSHSRSGSALTSGKALKAPSLRALFQLAASEQALCFISIGTVLSRKAVRARPAAGAYVSTLDAERGVVPGF